MTPQEQTAVTATIGVMIPTFRRVDLLVKNLDSLKAQTSSGFKIFVADNDGSSGDGERAAVDWAKRAGFADRLHAIRIHEQGLSSARNGGLKLAFSDTDIQAVAMIDDDTEAGPDWIEAIARVLATSDGDVFGGPTIYTFAIPVSPEVAEADVFAVPYDRQGPVPRLRATNNCVITRKLFDRLGSDLFDAAFNQTAGEDQHFFRRCQLLGVTSIWMPEAKVFEVVPESRCNEQWLVTRHRRSAANAVRIDKALNGTAQAYLRQVPLILREIASGIIKSLSPDRKTRFTGQMRLVGVAGRLDGLRGRLILHDSAASLKQGVRR